MILCFERYLEIDNLARLVKVSGDYSVTRDAYGTGDSPTLVAFDYYTVTDAQTGEDLTRDFEPTEVLAWARDYMQGN